jgi:hypothetical protein
MPVYDRQMQTCSAVFNTEIALLNTMAIIMVSLPLRLFFHLAERKPLNIHTFSQNDVTKARSELAQAFAPTSAFIPRNVFRNCFPMLRGESTIDSNGVEIITPVQSITRNTRNTRSHPIAFLGDGKSGLSVITFTSPQKSDNVHVSDDLAKPKSVLQQSEASQKKKRLHNEISLTEKCPIASTLTPSSTISTTQSMELNDATNNDEVDSRISDTTLYRTIMEEKKLECFNDLADVNLIIYGYEARTGNQLRIQKS